MRDAGNLLSLLAAMAAAVGGAVARAQSTASVPASSIGATTEALEKIIVTAQKRDENLQRTAAAITVLTSEVLQDSGVVDLRAAQKLVPSVRFQAEGASTEVYLRGVGSTLDLPNIEPPTTVNFNGIYIAREATSGPLFDVNRIEVLPGPQAEDQAYEEWIVGAEADWRIGDLSTGVRRPLHARGHHAQPTRGHRGVRAGDVRARRRLAHRRGRPLQLRPARGRRPRRATSSMKRHSRPSPSA